MPQVISATGEAGRQAHDLAPVGHVLTNPAVSQLHHHDGWHDFAYPTSPAKVDDPRAVPRLPDQKTSRWSEPSLNGFRRDMETRVSELEDS